MAPSVEKLAETGVFFTVTSAPTVMNVPPTPKALCRGPRWAVGGVGRA